MLFNDRVRRPHQPRHGPLQRRLRSLCWMPQIRIVDRLMIFFGRAERLERESRFARERLEMPVGDKEDLVPALAQFQRQPKQRMHVAGAADGDHDDFHGPNYTRNALSSGAYQDRISTKSRTASDHYKLIMYHYYKSFV